MNTRIIQIPGTRDTLEIPLPGKSGDWQGYGKALCALDDEIKRLKNATEELLDIATRMAQEITDFIDEAEQAGSPLPGVKALIDEWEEIHAKHNPLAQLRSNQPLPKGLANL